MSADRSAAAASIMLLTAAAMVAERRVLVQRRPVGKVMAGLWEFPGGKVEPGEGAEQALVRELAEELGIVVAVDALTPLSFATGRAGARDLVLLLFAVREWRGVPQALAAERLAWHSVAALHDLPMPPADRPLLAPLAAFLAQ